MKIYNTSWYTRFQIEGLKGIAALRHSGDITASGDYIELLPEGYTQDAVSHRDTFIIRDPSKGQTSEFFRNLAEAEAHIN